MTLEKSWNVFQFHPFILRTIKCGYSKKDLQEKWHEYCAD